MLGMANVPADGVSEKPWMSVDNSQWKMPAPAMLHHEIWAYHVQVKSPCGQERTRWSFRGECFPRDQSLQQHASRQDAFRRKFGRESVPSANHRNGGHRGQGCDHDCEPGNED